MLALVMLLGWASGAHARLNAPATHGGDPVALDLRREIAGPQGGPFGRALGAAAAEKSLSAAVLAALPEAWCGEQRSTDDTAHELANGDYKYHAVYAFPSDGADRFGAVASTLQTDAFQASALLELRYERAIRLDMGTSCGKQFLDISALRLPQSTAQLQVAAASGAEALFAEIEHGLELAGFDVLGTTENATAAAAKTRNFLVWLDGPTPAAGTCGIGTLYADSSRAASNWNNYGGKVALVLRNGSGFCASNVVRHEIGHNLGALQPGAPHAFDGAHCNDAYEDTMCYPASPQVSGGHYEALYFDYQNDDYWDPEHRSLPFWTVNLSRFICADAACNTPDGHAYERPLDRDRDLIPDALDNCPYVANPDQANTYGDQRGDACEADPRANAATTARRVPNDRIRIFLRIRRAGKRHWRIRLQLIGIPRSARVTVRCRRGPRIRAVYRGTLAVPGLLLLRPGCDGRPRVALAST